MNSDNTENYLYQPELKPYLCETSLSKINDCLGKGQVNEAFALVASSTALTITQIQALEFSFYNANLNCWAEANFKGVDTSDFKHYLYALLVKGASAAYQKKEHIWELLDNSLGKVSELGHPNDYMNKLSDAGHHHRAFAQNITVGFDDSNYWVVTTSYKIGEHEGVHTSLVSDIEILDADKYFQRTSSRFECRQSNLVFNHEDDNTLKSYPATVEVVEKIIGYKEAYKLSGGIFKLHKRKPAFVLDGFISQPKEIRQVTADVYEVLAKHVQSSSLKLKDDSNSEVNKAIKHGLKRYAGKVVW